MKKISKTLNISLCLGILFITFLFESCLKKDLYQGKDDNGGQKNEDNVVFNQYHYPFSKEVVGPEAEITLTLNEHTIAKDISANIPLLKYNKTMLFMLTQDDCKQSAFCRTWAAINGKPITNHSTSERSFYYDIENLESNDLPPGVYHLGKTLGSTDGNGKEVRFHFTTTLAAQWDFMNAEVSVRRGFTENYYRFYMKSGLRWSNVVEMLNYGTGIALHDVKTDYTKNTDSLLKHFQIAQLKTKAALQGRAFKFLSEPNGNKSYVQAALMFNDIQTMTAQTGGTILVPYQVSTDLDKVLLERVFLTNESDGISLVRSKFEKDARERQAVHLGFHETGNGYVQLLLWLNNTYGKDGLDSLWVPSQEEYYEYNYNRQHSRVEITTENRTIKIKVKFPNKIHFYYPSLTLNIPGIQLEKIADISSNEAVKGLSYGSFEDGISINIDCRKHLYEQAEYYTEKYLSNRTNSNLKDAKYFVNMLKDSEFKTSLTSKLSD